MSTYQPSARRPIADTFRRTADGAVDWCVRHRIHPDTVSYLSIVASLVAGICFWLSGRWSWLLLVAPLPCYLRLWFNMLDGMVALASKTASRRGEILNELPDRISDVLVFAGVAHSELAHTSLAYWAAIMALFTAYVGMLGQAVGARREFGGVMSKPWRMVTLHIAAWVTLLFILFGANPWLGGFSVLDWACIVIIVGCLQTVAVRLHSTFKLLNDAQLAEHDSAENAPIEPLASTEHTFKTWDGAELFYRAWQPRTPTTKALILLHRGHEHSGRLAEVVARLKLSDVAIFAWDQRGHGNSPGERGGAESLAAVVKDLDHFAKFLVETHGIKLTDTILIAHSVGGVVGAAWVHDYAPPLRGMILATPALRVKLYVPFAIPALRLRHKLFGGGHVKSYVKSRVLTHAPIQQAAYDADSMIFRQIAVNILLDLYDAGTRLIDDAGAITVPTLLLSAGNDWVVKLSAQWKFFERLSSHNKQMEVFPGMFHAIFHERGRQRVVDRMRTFIDQCFGEEREDPTHAMLEADRGGYTRTEYDRLRLPGSIKWSIARTFMRTVGTLSDGIKLGKKEGFDSGVMLDYVYANKPSGTTPLGRFIDKQYLNSPGWSGIRQRRTNLQRLLRFAIDDLRSQGKPIHILDIAAGAGRYVLETLKALESDIPATAVLRDYKQANLDAAKRLADELGLSDRVTVEFGDAFDRASISAIEPKPTIAIVSGLFELIPENAPPRRALDGFADAVAPGGYLIYTCQPWHPQIEFIARVLTNREGQPWIMRRRTQQEMDALVRAAGFEKISQDIDRWGIFTVSIAKRIGT